MLKADDDLIRQYDRVSTRLAEIDEEIECHWRKLLFRIMKQPGIAPKPIQRQRRSYANPTITTHAPIRVIVEP